MTSFENSTHFWIFLTLSLEDDLKIQARSTIGQYPDSLHVVTVLGVVNDQLRVGHRDLLLSLHPHLLLHAEVVFAGVVVKEVVAVKVVAVVV